MKNVIEIEKKFYCDEIEKLINLSLEKKFLMKKEIIENDEYFTDLAGEFIKNRTCLRIRKTNNNKMEITFKGKSKVNTNFYAKNESNIDVNICEYDNFIELFSALGYHSYTVVNKKRMIYSKTINGVDYNIMIDNIEGIGAFVEFELICDTVNSISKMEKEFNKFLLEFSDIKFEDALLPYRDFVAEDILNKCTNSNEIDACLFDLDGTIINSETNFYESFKKVLIEDYGIAITEKDYQKNELEKNQNLITYLKEKLLLKHNVSDEKIMEKVYKIYSDKFEECLYDKYTLTIISLIKFLKNDIKIGLVTTSKKIFVDKFLKSIEATDIFDVVITREDVENLKPMPDAYNLAIEKLNINKKNVIAFEDSDRGLSSAKQAGINVVKVNKFSNSNNQNEFKDIDSLVRILLIILYS